MLELSSGAANSWTARSLDLLIVGNVILVGMMGYFHAHAGTVLWRNHIESMISVVTPQLIVASFVAINFPFRLPTRLSWLVLAPAILWTAIFLGAYVEHILVRAPDSVVRAYSLNYLPMTLWIYLLSSTVWLIPARLGWQLKRPTAYARRSVRLVECLVMTAIAGILLGLLRNVVQEELVDRLSATLVGHFQNMEYVVTTAMLRCFVLLPFVWLCFCRNRILAIIGPLAWSCFAPAFLVFYGEYAFGYNSVCFMVIAVNALFLRFAGFHLERKTQTDV